MSEQSEALRLADRLEGRWALHPEMQEAAAKLRRLHASCEDYAQHKQRQDQRVLELAERVLELKAQRDGLLEACKTLVNLPETEDWIATLRLAVEQARAAIKAVEGEKK